MPTGILRDVLRELLDDLVILILMDVQALQRRAGLAGVDETTPEQLLQQRFDVRARQHDAGVVAAEFQGHPLQVLRGAAHDLLAGGDRAGEHDLVDARVVGEVVADFDASRHRH